LEITPSGSNDKDWAHFVDFTSDLDNQIV
jgi:hypothetical protein